MKKTQILLLGLLLSAGTACDLPFVDLFARILSMPASVAPGAPMTVTHRVCNRGDMAADPSLVVLMLRPEGDPAASTVVHVEPLPPLEPLECADFESELTLPPVPDGAYEIVSQVDPDNEISEPHTVNNVAVSHVFGIGYGPDLVVDTITGPPSALSGDWVPLQGEVCNRGTDWSLGGTLMLLFSTDDDIAIDPPLPDWPAGDLDLPPLGPGECGTVSGDMQVVVPDGVYTLGGIADPGQVVYELVETNNAAPGATIAVGFGPDLVVSSVTGPPSATNGGAFDAVVTACNQGTVASGGAMASVHLSSDDSIEPAFPDPAGGDPWVGGMPVPSLDPGACHTDTVPAGASVPADGPWYLGAFVDPDQFVSELREDNNGHADALMGVGNGPDWIVTSVSGPPSADGGFDVDVTVCNQGTEPGSGVMVEVFLADESVGGHPVGWLAPGECEQETVPAFASPPGPDGPYPLSARVDPFDDEVELIESNNDRSGGVIGIGSAPDLIVQSIEGPDSAENYGPFPGSATICNQGTMPSAPTQVTFYHSADTTLAGGAAPPGPFPNDFWAGVVGVPGLEPGACTPVSGTLTAQVDSDGAYYLGAVVDDPQSVAELIETNNTRVGDVMGVGFGPDLRVESVTAPPSAFPGSEITLDFEVCNVGTAGVAGALVRLYLAEEPEDYELASVGLPPLGPGACHADSKQAFLPSGADGPETVGGTADPFDSVPELVESNNQHAGSVIGIGAGPDYVIESIEAPASSFQGASMWVTVSACNQGTTAGSYFDVMLYLSDDEQIEGSYFNPPGPDPGLGMFPMPSLAPGACHTEALETWPFTPFDGAWTVGGIADEGQYAPELREDNNTFAGGLVGIGNAPDLVVESIVIPPSVVMGAPFPITADVCNRGTAPSPVSNLSLYHTEDEVVTGHFILPIGPDLWLDVAPVAPLPPDTCDTVAVTPSSPAAPGQWRVGGIIDEDASVPELIESNNTLVSDPHTVTP